VKFKLIVTLLVFCIVNFGSYYLGIWSGRNEWKGARQHIISDLHERGLDSKYLSTTTVSEDSLQNVSYGFTYKHNGVHIDYVLHYGGPRGVEMSFWDYSRTD